MQYLTNFHVYWFLYIIKWKAAFKTISVGYVHFLKLYLHKNAQEKKHLKDVYKNILLLCVWSPSIFHPAMLPLSSLWVEFSVESDMHMAGDTRLEAQNHKDTVGRKSTQTQALTPGQPTRSKHAIFLLHYEQTQLGEASFQHFQHFHRVVDPART